MTMIKGLLIDLNGINEIEIDSGDPFLDTLYKKLKCDCATVTSAVLPGTDHVIDLWVDDSGWLCEKEVYFGWSYHNMYAGAGIVLLSDGYGDCISHPLSKDEIEMVRARVRIFTKQEFENARDSSRM